MVATVHHILTPEAPALFLLFFSTRSETASGPQLCVRVLVEECPLAAEVGIVLDANAFEDPVLGYQRSTKLWPLPCRGQHLRVFNLDDFVLDRPSVGPGP